MQRVLEQRCVVCHGCYDAPCQLLLSSDAGIERGASKAVVYRTDRLTATEPTRLFIDAQGAAEWRKRGFFPAATNAGDRGAAPLLFQMVELGRAHPFAPDQQLPATYYDLVAGYDVFGNVTHQAATRLYMDHLRMQSENLFLTFLRADRRQGIRASWYVGATHSLDYNFVDALHGISHDTRIPFYLSRRDA